MFSPKLLVYCILMDERTLTDATDRTIKGLPFSMQIYFSAVFDFRGFFSGTSLLYLKIDGTAIDFKTRLRCTAKHTFLSALEFRGSNRHAEQGCQSTPVR